jgi:hypothetical protein
MTSPFDFINAINLTKKDLFLDDPQASKDYSSFMVNRGLSYFPDTIMLANEMNKYPNSPKDWQFNFLLNTVTKKKRFSKWVKKDSEPKAIQLVMRHYGYSSKRALEVLDILTSDQLKQIEETYTYGGK